MQIVSIIFYVLGGVGLALWGGLYWFVLSMSCALGGPNGGSCDEKWPWDLEPETLFALVILPGALVVALFLIAFFCGRAVKES